MRADQNVTPSLHGPDDEFEAALRNDPKAVMDAIFSAPLTFEQMRKFPQILITWDARFGGVLNRQRRRFLKSKFGDLPLLPIPGRKR